MKAPWPRISGQFTDQTGSGVAIGQISIDAPSIATGIAGIIETRLSWRAADNAPAMQADTPSATRSPLQCAPSVSPDPRARSASPANTPSIVQIIRRLIGSAIKIRLKIAAKTGIDARMNTTLATLVQDTANTNPGADIPISTV
jgi:hypothetical protein